MSTEATGQEPKKASLFSSAKVVEKKTATKEEKLSIVLKESEFPGFSNQLKRATEIRNISADLEAEGKMIEGQIKEIGKAQFINLYAKGKVNPGSFILKGEEGGAMMFIMMDKYLSIDSDRAEQLKETFGEDTVSTSVEYSFNPTLLEKYESVLSELIMNCKEITDEDKAELIVQKPKYSVSKGMIERVSAIAGNDAARMETVINSIQPVAQLKNSKG